MTLADTMRELADRCEAATGPDSDLERAIKAALLGREYISFEDDLAKRQAATPPRYTASLDAATMLVPEGLVVLIDQRTDHWKVTLWGDEFTCVAQGKAVTEALARTAAALRSRAAMAETNDCTSSNSLSSSPAAKGK